MKKVLITGINGFVGSNITMSWKDAHTLYGLDLTKGKKENVEQIYDWSEFNKLPQVDAIIHLAGIAHETKNKGNPDIYFDINAGLTQRIFEYFLDSDAKTFIFFSTVKAAADSLNGNILTEDVKPMPKGPYGESKLFAEENILKLMNDDYRAKNKNIYILRPSMIYGPGNKGNLNMLYKVVSKGIPWPLAAYDNLRSFCYVNNIIFILEQLIVNENVINGIYNVCDDEPLSTNELIKLINESVNKKPRLWKFSKGFMNAIASLGEVFRLPLNKNSLRKLTENYVVSNKKIKLALSIKKMPVSSYEGIKKTLDSFK